MILRERSQSRPMPPDDHEQLKAIGASSTRNCEYEANSHQGPTGSTLLKAEPPRSPMILRERSQSRPKPPDDHEQLKAIGASSTRNCEYEPNSHQGPTGPTLFKAEPLRHP